MANNCLVSVPPPYPLGCFLSYTTRRGVLLFSLLFFVFNFLIFLSGWKTLHILPTVFSSFPTAPLERIWSHRESGRILLLWLSGIIQWKNNSIERKRLVIYAIVSMSPLLGFSVPTGVQIVVPCLDCFNKFFCYLSLVSTINTESTVKAVQK